MGLFNKMMKDSKETLDTSKPSEDIKPQEELLSNNIVDLVNINKVFGSGKNEFKLFDNLNFSIPDFKDEGQFISILGASGCGKSQLMHLISGLQKPTSGDVIINGKPKKDNQSFPMVFQQYSSFPWLNVIDNVSLPLKLRGISKKERYERALKIIETVGLNGHEYKWTNGLSGGQQQRVAIARCLIESSPIIMLDEASSALDIKTKRGLQELLLDIYYKSEYDQTFISVTHNIEEAVYLSNRIYIMQANPGRVHTIMDIDLGKHRDHNTRSTEKFIRYVQQITDIMDSL